MTSTDIQESETTRTSDESIQNDAWKERLRLRQQARSAYFWESVATTHTDEGSTIQE
jgi:hypothetical protein